MGFDLLEKPVGTADLLLYLRQHGKASVRSILADTGMNRDTLYNAMNRLKSLDFAYRDEETGFPTQVYIGLTKAGEAFADALAPAEKMLLATVKSLESELDKLEREGRSESTTRRLELLDVLVERNFSCGRWGGAEEKATRLAALAHETKDSRHEIQGHVVLGRILQKRDRHEEASRKLSEALQLALTDGSEDLASEAESLLGADAERQGKWDDAEKRFDSAVEHAARAGSRLLGAKARQAKARLLAKRGRLEESIPLMMEVANEFERQGADSELPKVYVSLGSATYLLYRPEFIDWFSKAVDAARRESDVRMEAYGLAYASVHWIEAGQFRRAETDLAYARRVFEDLGEKTGMGTAELNTANLFSAEGRWPESEAHFEKALRIAHETGNKFQEAFALYNRGLMLKRRNLREESRLVLLAARQMFEALGNHALASECDKALSDPNHR
jgi:tetratricopeptide (TPR) repeat protein